MLLKDWDDLPKYMKTEAVRPYYDSIKKKKISLKIKRIFDFIIAILMLSILSPLFVVISVLIVKDSKGGIFYRQERVTQYGRKFKIFKFRTMVLGADQTGTQVTIQNDKRITKIGEKLRKYRVAALPQQINIILGDMTFCGTRPECVAYVKKYTPEMFATLLLPAGVTSEASIRFKDEAKLLENVDADEVYIKEILPRKMKYNLASIKTFSILNEMKVLFGTILAILKKG